MFTLKPGDMGVDTAILNLGHFMRQKKEQGAPSGKKRYTYVIKSVHNTWPHTLLM